MTFHNINIKYEEINFDQLDEQTQNLFALAEQQIEISYAPYSQFNVGAAVLLENQEITVGCNQENASYPLCMCAERVALYNAGSNHPGKEIEAIVISCRNNKKAIDAPVSPCGACRQVIHEFSFRQKKNFPIFLKVFGNQTIYKFESIDELLPFSFNADYLL